MTKDQFVFNAIKEGIGYTDALKLWNQGHSTFSGQWTTHINEAEEIVIKQVAVLNAYHGMQVRPVISWGRHRNNSWGGYGGNKISLAMKRHVPSDSDDSTEVFTFNEYNRFAASPTIGTFKGTWQDCLKCLVAHEHAHCHPKSVGHGSEWQKIYAVNRQQFKLNGENT